jgi:hypothetical protein
MVKCLNCGDPFDPKESGIDLLCSDGCLEEYEENMDIGEDYYMEE